MREKQRRDTSSRPPTATLIKALVKQEMDNKACDMYEGRAPSPYTSSPSIIGSANEYRRKARAYRKRLQRELAEFNNALARINARRGRLIHRAVEALRKRREGVIRLLIYEDCPMSRKFQLQCST